MGISLWQILILLAIVLLLFGTKKLRSTGADMGEAIKGFRHAVRDENDSGEALATKRDTGDRDGSAS